jgi:hypothetical protein
VSRILLLLGVMVMRVIAGMIMVAGLSMMFGMHQLRIAMVRRRTCFGPGHAPDRAARHERGCQQESKNLLGHVHAKENSEFLRSRHLASDTSDRVKT